MTSWAFAHPWLTTIIALAVIEAVAAPFRWQRRRTPRPTGCRNWMPSDED